VRLYDEDGMLVAEALGFELRNLQAQDVQTAAARAAAPQFFETVWESLGGSPALPSGASVGRWLFLADGDAVTRSLQRALQAAGATVQEVAMSQCAEAVSLLSAQLWTGVVYGWSLAAKTPDAIGWHELLSCVKAAAARSGQGAARWVFLTARGADSLAQSPLTGFVTALAHEHPESRPLHLELDATDAALERWVPWLLDHSGSERRLRYHQGAVQGVRLVERPLQAKRPVVRPDGCYLITGAAGALGRAVAAWLVAQGARSLCLAGRREAPADLKSLIASWEQQGVRVTFETAEMGEAESVRQLVARAGAGQRLCGVFHAAGALRDGLLRQMDSVAFTSIFEAKINGAWELHQATKDRDLDCFVLFSSIASLLGSPGQANYAAANAFMDALASERQKEGLSGLSIQWGPWDGIGMTARLGARDRQRLHERGLLAMAPIEAIWALEQVLGSSGCVGIFAWNRRTYRLALPAELPAFYRRILAAENGGATPAVVTGPAVQHGYASMPLAGRSQAIERLIRETVATLLGLDSYLKVDREKGLFDLGIDSLTAIDLKDRLEKAVGQTLRSTIAFDYPTAAEMAAHLAVILSPAVDASASVPIVNAGTGAKSNVVTTGDFERLSASDLEALLEKELSD
jgi:NAD(P)-dependent dehydrogenase (short-subunit alcohol dehydrogenase family)/acyl carrier protein